MRSNVVLAPLVGHTTEPQPLPRTENRVFACKLTKRLDCGLPWIHATLTLPRTENRAGTLCGHSLAGAAFSQARADRDLAEAVASQTERFKEDNQANREEIRTLQIALRARVCFLGLMDPNLAFATP